MHHRLSRRRTIGRALVRLFLGTALTLVAFAIAAAYLSDMAFGITAIGALTAWLGITLMRWELGGVRSTPSR